MIQIKYSASVAVTWAIPNWYRDPVRTYKPRLIVIIAQLRLVSNEMYTY